MALTRSEILSAVDMPTKTVPVERWGGEIIVRGMPVADTGYVNFINRPVEVAKGVYQPPSDQERQVRRFVGAVILCALDENGEQLFKWSDATRLREKHWLTVLEVATEAFALAGEHDDDEVQVDDEGKLTPISDVDLGKGSSPATGG